MASVVKREVFSLGEKSRSNDVGHGGEGWLELGGLESAAGGTQSVGREKNNVFHFAMTEKTSFVWTKKGEAETIY